MVAPAGRVAAAAKSATRIPSAPAQRPGRAAVASPTAAWAAAVEKEKNAAEQAKESVALTTRGRLWKHQQQWIEDAHYYKGCGFVKDINEENRLPQGWKSTKDSYGRTFYSHYESGHSSWVEPVVVQIPWKYRKIVHKLSHLLSTASETQWVRVTLEAAQDRFKLFTALYEMVLDNVLTDTHKFFVSTNSAVDKDIPTLAECHKRANKRKLREDQYVAFIEHTLRSGKKKFEESHESTLPGPKPRTPKSCAYSPKRKTTDAVVDSPRSTRSRSRVSLTSVGSQVRSRSSGARENSPAHLRASQSRWRSESPVKTSLLTSDAEPTLNMAEYGSLQARTFRERRMKQLAIAQQARAHSQSQFGRPESVSPKKKRADASEAVLPQLPNVSLLAAPPTKERVKDSALKETLKQVDLVREQVTAAMKVSETSSRNGGNELDDYLEYDQGQLKEDLESEPLNIAVEEKKPTSNSQNKAAYVVDHALQSEKQARLELSIAKDELSAIRRAHDNLRGSNEDLVRQIEALKVSTDQSLTEAKNREEALLSRLEAIQSSSSRLVLSRNESSEEEVSDISDRSNLLDRLTRANAESREANEQRLRAEKRAQEASERVTKLSQSLSLAVARSESERQESEQLREELALAQEALAECVRARDSVLDDLRSTRESHFVTLEAERVERTLLQREISQLKTQLIEFKRRGQSSHTLNDNITEDPSGQKKEILRSLIANERAVPLRVQAFASSPRDTMVEEAKSSAASPKSTSSLQVSSTFKLSQNAEEKRVEPDEMNASKLSPCCDHANVVEQQVCKLEELGKELFDCKCSLSRLTQRLKQSENEGASLRYEIKSTRQAWKSAETKLESRIAQAQAQAQEYKAAAEQSETNYESVKNEIHRVEDQFETLAIHAREVEAKLQAVEHSLKEQQENNVAMRRGHEQELSARQIETAAYRQSLEQHYTRCKAVWEKEHAAELEGVRLAHASELMALKEQSRDNMRRGLDESRKEFSIQVENLERTFSERYATQQKANERELELVVDRLRREATTAQEALLRIERERCKEEIAECYISKELEIVKQKRRTSLSVCQKTLLKRITLLKARAWMRWNEFTSSQRVNDLVEAYGTAIEKTHAASRLTVLMTKSAQRLSRQAFSVWYSATSTKFEPMCIITRTTNPVKRDSSSLVHIGESQKERDLNEFLFYMSPMYPSELSRKMRRKLPEPRFGPHIVKFVESLDVNLDGKIVPNVFQRALLVANPFSSSKVSNNSRDKADFFAKLRLVFAPLISAYTSDSQGRPQQSTGMPASEAVGHEEKGKHTENNMLVSVQDPICLMPSANWLAMAAVAVTRISCLVDHRSALVKSRAFARLRMHALLGVSRGNLPSAAHHFVESAFMREMETKALQEEVRALHVQLGASKAEAWRFKRKILNLHSQASK